MIAHSAVEEGLAVFDDGDGLPGEMVAGVGEEGEDEHGHAEHGLPPGGETGDQARHLQQCHAGGQLHNGVICRESIL